ncbi:ABC transporter permease [Sinanaerobacter chloroacetimidivorans]|uniref:ABC transporter permease subunit n=1 Tax=Sinanaerobacter chloroacetimidivorans TaxID=2818044 RepID=A0A8J8B0H0_9FIRM|nr:ABC transporter permease subunit [Sinanaerobacter chloroacetimidivorans]MBR0597174.1 ABC transporter permease subunit [Sinanaerobacter chloroacetimidivorans]
MKTTKKSKEKLIIIFWIFVMLIIWQLAATIGGISSLLLPSIGDVAAALTDSFLHGDLAYQLYYSLRVILIGIVIAILSAILLAFAAQKSMIMSGLVKVLSAIGHPLPALALLPLIIVWFGTGDASIIAIIVHSALWPILINLNSGFQAVPQIYLDIGRNLELSPLEIAYEIKLKASLPYLISGVKIAFARSWRALIGAEMVFGAIGLKGGIGWYIFKQRTFMNTSGLFAGIIVVILVGLLIERILFDSIEKRTVLKWGQSKI